MVLGAVIGWGQPSALQLPQRMDVEPQSLLLSWLSLLGPVLQDRHGRVYVEKGCMESAMGLGPPKSPVSAIRSVHPSAPSGISARALAGAGDQAGLAGEPPILRGLRIRPSSPNSAPVGASQDTVLPSPARSCLAHCTGVPFRGWEGRR